MPNEMIHLQPSKTYKNAENARRAIKDFHSRCRYFIAYTEEGRAFVVFVGQQALRDGLHFSGHVCVG